MSKRLIVKLAVMAAALSAMTLLQGCEDEENSFVVMTAWLPVGSVLPFEVPHGVAVGASQGAAGGAAGQAVGAGGSGQVSIGLEQ
jgi:hypothetical protein